MCKPFQKFISRTSPQGHLVAETKKFIKNFQRIEKRPTDKTKALSAGFFNRRAIKFQNFILGLSVLPPNADKPQPKKPLTE